MAVTLYMDVFSAGTGVVSGLATLMFVLYGVPLTFIAASPDSSPSSARIADAFTALALGALFFGCTFTFAKVNTADEDGALNIRLLFDVQNALIFAFFCVRYLISGESKDRDFFKAMTLFAATYMLTAGYINHFEMETAFGGLSDLLINIPFLALFVCAAARREGRPALVRWRVPDAVAGVMTAASPLWLPLTLFAVSCFLIFRNPWLAVAGFLAALLGHATRGILVDLKSQAENRRLDHLSRIDPLTQLCNRRTFDVTLSTEFRRASRSGQDLSLLMVDIDHFKILNDTFGHPEGDRYLREVSRTLAAFASRAGDVVARYGGEEFAIILPGSDASAAAKISENILGAVVGLALPSPSRRGIVTVSIGLASLADAPMATEAQLVKAADVALYQAKQSGRNCFVQSREGSVFAAV